MIKKFFVNIIMFLHIFGDQSILTYSPTWFTSIVTMKDNWKGVAKWKILSPPFHICILAAPSHIFYFVCGPHSKFYFGGDSPPHNLFLSRTPPPIFIFDFAPSGSFIAKYSPTNYKPPKERSLLISIIQL